MAEEASDVAELVEQCTAHLTAIFSIHSEDVIERLVLQHCDEGLSQDQVIERCANELLQLQAVEHDAELAKHLHFQETAELLKQTEMVRKSQESAEAAGDDATRRANQQVPQPGTSRQACAENRMPAGCSGMAHQVHHVDGSAPALADFASDDSVEDYAYIYDLEASDDSLEPLDADEIDDLDKELEYEANQIAMLSESFRRFGVGFIKHILERVFSFPERRQIVINTLCHLNGDTTFLRPTKFNSCGRRIRVVHTHTTSMSERSVNESGKRPASSSQADVGPSTKRQCRPSQPMSGKNSQLQITTTDEVNNVQIFNNQGGLEIRVPQKYLAEQAVTGSNQIKLAGNDSLLSSHVKKPATSTASENGAKTNGVTQNVKVIPNQVASSEPKLNSEISKSNGTVSSQCEISKSNEAGSFLGVLQNGKAAENKRKILSQESVNSDTLVKPKEKGASSVNQNHASNCVHKNCDNKENPTKMNGASLL